MISLPPKGSTAKKLGANFTPLRVEAQSTPNMTVQVTEGAFWTAANEYMEYFGGTSPTITAPASDAKWVLLTVTATGLLNVIDGVPAGVPTLPLPATYNNELPLAAIFVGDTTSAITDDMVFDARPLWTIPPDSVSQAQLTNFATITYVNNGLILKADTTGTANADFTLNVGASAINDSGVYIDRLAGPNVGIRFNEVATAGSPPVANPQWEFTNDGVVWNPIGVSTGSFYTKPDLDGGALDFLYYRESEFVGVPGAGVLDSRYYEQSIANSTFALNAHTHVVGDIIGLSNPVNTINLVTPTAGNIQLGLDELNDVTISGTTTAAVIRYDGSVYRNAILTIDDLGDVSLSAPAVNDALVWNGTTFLNRPLVKTDITDLDLSATGDFVLVTDGLGGAVGVPQDIFGVKTFKDGMVIENSLIVTGASTSIQTTELQVTDSYVDINFGEAGAGVDNGTGVSGVRIDRGSLTDAIIQWDEGAQQWEIGTVGSVGAIITGAHTHVAGDITDFAVAVTTQLAGNPANSLSDVTYVSAPSTGDYFRYGVAAWENQNFTTDFTAELNANNLDQMQDVTYTALVSGEFLRYNGTAFVNYVPVKADISDFVEADYIHTTGIETKTGDFTLNGDFTVGGGVGTVTTINSETLNVLDSSITLNFGEVGNGVGGGTGTSGILVDRGTHVDGPALFQWSEGANTWFAHNTTAHTLTAISFVGHSHIVSDITDLSVSASEINTLSAINTGVTVQSQLNDKISRTGDAMDSNADLTFSVGGEVLGLPAVPSGITAATSMAYVDTQDALGGAALVLHASDLTLHMTAPQNTFMDALNLPTLTGAEVNQLSGISGNVQTLLDTKSDKIIPALVNNLSGLDVAGNLTDSGLILNDAGILVSEIWSAAQIDTTKADKILPALVNNLSGLDVAGNLTDSGLILNDAGILVSEIWSAAQIDTTKMDKLVGVAGNFAEFDATGNVVDNGNNGLTFAANIHPHLVADITDFALGVTTELGTNSINAIQDVNSAAAVSGDFLRFNGTSWVTTPAASIGDFVHRTGAINEAIDGEKTFSDNAFFQNDVTITQNITVNGTNAVLPATSVNGSMTVTGNLTIMGDQITQGEEVVSTRDIVLNFGSTDPLSANGGGVILQRDTAGSPPLSIIPNAVIIWDHATSKWQAGLDNVVENVALENVTVAQPEYELQAGTGIAAYGLAFGVQAPTGIRTGIQVFVNGLKQIEGLGKTYTVDYTNLASTVVTFNAGEEPALSDDVEFYGFGFIG